MHFGWCWVQPAVYEDALWWIPCSGRHICGIWHVHKSNKTKKPRCLTVGGKTILSSQFIDAYNWDQNSHSLPMHERLTQKQFHINPSQKMRNNLAEDVLNSKILFLMKVMISCFIYIFTCMYVCMYIYVDVDVDVHNYFNQLNTTTTKYNMKLYCIHFLLYLKRKSWNWWW